MKEYTRRLLRIVVGVVFVVPQRIVPHVQSHADGIELARPSARTPRPWRSAPAANRPLLCVVKGKVEERIHGGASQRVDRRSFAKRLTWGCWKPTHCQQSRLRIAARRPWRRAK